jgi:hypothetical protein
MDRHRILELAVEELERQKTAVDAEITAIRAELGETGSKTTENVKLTVAVAGKNRRRTPAEREAQSLRLKKYWAAKRAKAAKTKKPNSPKPKLEKAPVGKAISKAMRIYWAKKRAETANKAKIKPSKVPQKSS